MVTQSLQQGNVLQVITNLIKETVASAVSQLQKALEENTNVMRDLRAAVEERDRTITAMQTKTDDLEQYQRRQCLRIFGVEEKHNENTDQLVMQVAQKIGVE